MRESPERPVRLPSGLSSVLFVASEGPAPRRAGERAFSPALRSWAAGDTLKPAGFCLPVIPPGCGAAARREWGARRARRHRVAPGGAPHPAAAQPLCLCAPSPGGHTLSRGSSVALRAPAGGRAGPGLRALGRPHLCPGPRGNGVCWLLDFSSAFHHTLWRQCVE